jgi:uncharacterized protein involved in copper resistance
MHCAIVVAVALFPLLGASQEYGPGEAILRAAGAEQRRILVSGDAAAQERFIHPNFINMSRTEAGLRFRYEIVPDFAPYVGVQYGRAFGDTARFRRAAVEDVGGWTLLLGVRTWF